MSDNTRKKIKLAKVEKCINRNQAIHIKTNFSDKSIIQIS